MNPDALQDIALRALRAFQDALPPGLRAAFERLEGRAHVLSARPPGYFLHPLALPILELPAWAGAEGEGLRAAVEAAALGYLHVRAQDDLLDEAAGDAGEVMLLADALLLAHVDALRAACPDPALRPLILSRWQAYQEAMLLERALKRGACALDEAAEQQLHDRSLPMLLPPAAALLARGQGARIRQLEILLRLLAAAHQLQMDLIDVEKDAAQPGANLAVARLGGAADRHALRRRLLSEGGLDRLFAEVDARFAELSAAAGGAWPGLAEHAERRRRGALEMKQRMLAAYFKALLGG